MQGVQSAGTGMRRRDYDDAEALSHFMDELARRVTIDAVIDGAARGVDRMAGEWVQRRSIESIKFRADREKFGQRPDPFAISRCWDEGSPDVVVAFPGGRGTADMIRRARSASVRAIEAVGQTSDTP